MKLIKKLTKFIILCRGSTQIVKNQKIVDELYSHIDHIQEKIDCWDSHIQGTQEQLDENKDLQRFLKGIIADATNKDIQEIQSQEMVQD